MRELLVFNVVRNGHARQRLLALQQHLELRRGSRPLSVHIYAGRVLLSVPRGHVVQPRISLQPRLCGLQHLARVRLRLLQVPLHPRG